MADRKLIVMNGGLLQQLQSGDDPVAPTQSAGDNSTKVATTAYVDAAVSGGLNIAGLTEDDLATDDYVPFRDTSGSDNNKVSISRLLGFTSASLCEGRLSLESGVSVSTTDQTGKTNVYFTPHIGDRISIYDGTRLRLYAFSELTLALGTLVNAQAYDIFVYDNAGTLTLEATEWANATITCTSATPAVVTWTAHGMVTGNTVTFTNSGGALPTGISANTQYWVTRIDANTFKISTSSANVGAGTFVNTSSTGTGTHTGHHPQARQTALVRQNGAWYKSGALTRRHLGTFLTTTTTTTEDSETKRYLRNRHNPEPRHLKSTDSSDRYTTSTTPIQVGSVQISFVSDGEQSVRVTGKSSVYVGSAGHGIMSIGTIATTQGVNTTQGFFGCDTISTIYDNPQPSLEEVPALGLVTYYLQLRSNLGATAHADGRPWNNGSTSGGKPTTALEAMILC